jgi:hypothetical protein
VGGMLGVAQVVEGDQGEVIVRDTRLSPSLPIWTPDMETSASVPPLSCSFWGVRYSGHSTIGWNSLSEREQNKVEDPGLQCDPYPYRQPLTRQAEVRRS